MDVDDVVVGDRRTVLSAASMGGKECEPAAAGVGGGVVCSHITNVPACLVAGRESVLRTVLVAALPGGCARIRSARGLSVPERTGVDLASLAVLPNFGTRQYEDQRLAFPWSVDGLSCCRGCSFRAVIPAGGEAAHSTRPFEVSLHKPHKAETRGRLSTFGAPGAIFQAISAARA